MSDTTPIPPASERERFEAMLAATEPFVKLFQQADANRDQPMDSNSSIDAQIAVRDLRRLVYAADDARAALSHPSTPQGWQPIDSAPEGELVVVGWLDAEDTEHPERHDFDWLEDGLWQKHSADHEHFLMVAPPGSRGPSEKAPYTHWQRIGAIPAPPEQGGKG